MGFTLDASELNRLAKGMAQYQGAFPKTKVSQALRKASKPMLDAAKAQVPVGRIKSENGWGRYTGSAYARGGTTRRDLRIRVVAGEGVETTRVIVGVSKKKGKVGWRTAFITRGVRGGGRKRSVTIAADDFLQRAYDATVEPVQSQFYKELFTNYIEWGTKTLPRSFK